MEEKFDLIKYLETDHQSKKNFYDFFAFFINLKFKQKKIKNPFIKKNKYYLFFYHEYTHYLQSFCTVYGVNELIEFFKFQRKVLKDMANKIVKNEFYGPADYKKLFSSDYNDIINNYSYDLSASAKSFNKNFVLDIQFLKDSETNIMKLDYVLQIDNKLLDISPLCLRETMAMMTYFINKKMSNDKIIYYIKKKNLPPIYSYLFLYFSNKYPKINDLSTLLYYICELSLQSKNPTDNLTIILDYINKNYAHYTNAKDFIKKLWDINKTFENNSIIMLEELKNFLNENIKYIHGGNQYFYLINKYLQKCKIGLNYINGKKSVLIDKAKLSNILKTFIPIFSSPILIQNKNKTKKMYCFDKNANVHTELSTFFAVTVCMEKYIRKGEEFNRCPFFSNIKYNPKKKYKSEDICILKMNNAILELCANKPYEIRSSINGDCPFYNANKILGYQDEEEIQKSM